MDQRVDRKTKILIVDDFSMMRRLVRKLLEELGFSEIVEATNGAEALTKLEGAKFGLIISDWKMPTMAGIDLLKAVRASDRHKHIPFLMITAEVEKNNILEAAKAGLSEYIVKPFTMDSLEQKIGAILGTDDTSV